MANEPTTTITGNLTADPEIRFTQIPRGFAITEGVVRSNPRLGCGWRPLGVFGS